MRSRFLLALPFALVVASAQAQEMGSLDDDMTMPLTIKATSLNSNFKAIKIKTQGAGSAFADLMAGPMMVMGGIFGAMGGAEKAEDEGMGIMTAMALNWTTGEVRTVLGQRYLVTYKLDMDFADMMRMDPKVRDLSGSDLRLELVRTDTIISLMPRPDVTPAAYLKMLKLLPPPKPAEPPKPDDEEGAEEKTPPPTA